MPKTNLETWTKRPLSWSSISSFEYNPDLWYKRYILNEKEEGSSAMAFGKKIGEDYPFEATFEREYKLQGMIADIELVGFIDAFDFQNKKLIELKTGKKWDRKKAETHGQLDLYCALLYIMHKINPKDLDISLIWLATEETGAFETQFIPNMKPVIFKVKKTMLDVVNMLVRVKQVRKKMLNYIEKREPQFSSLSDPTS